MKERRRIAVRPSASAHAAPVLVKFGGELLEDGGQIDALASALAKLWRKVPLVVVHGGGREIDSALTRAGIDKRQVDGLRITDEATLDIVVGVLAGLVNTRFVGMLAAAGVQAVGLTGADAGVALVEPAAQHVASSGARVDLGRVGVPISSRRPALLLDLCRRGYMPVVASIGAARDGRLFNVNADTFAAYLAYRLGSPRLIIAGTTAGVLDRDGTTIPHLVSEDLGALVRNGSATAGMIAKLAACRRALDRGVREVFITDGRDLEGLAGLARDGLRSGSSTQITKYGALTRRQTGMKGAGRLPALRPVRAS